MTRVQFNTAFLPCHNAQLERHQWPFGPWPGLARQRRNCLVRHVPLMLASNASSGMGRKGRVLFVLVWLGNAQLSRPLGYVRTSDAPDKHRTHIPTMVSMVDRIRPHHVSGDFFDCLRPATHSTIKNQLPSTSDCIPLTRCANEGARQLSIEICMGDAGQ